jgi:hypothetical protein
MTTTSLVARNGTRCGFQGSESVEARLQDLPRCPARSWVLGRRFDSPPRRVPSKTLLSTLSRDAGGSERLVQALFRWRGAGSTSSPSAFDAFRRCGSGHTPYRLDGQRSHGSPRSASVYRCEGVPGRVTRGEAQASGGGGPPLAGSSDVGPYMRMSTRAARSTRPERNRGWTFTSRTRWSAHARRAAVCGRFSGLAERESVGRRSRASCGLRSV